MNRALIISCDGKISCEEFSINNGKYQSIGYGQSEYHIALYLSKLLKNKIKNIKSKEKDLIVELDNMIIILENYIKLSKFPFMDKLNQKITMYMISKKIEDKKIVLKKESKYIKRRIVVGMSIPIMLMSANLIDKNNNIEKEVTNSNVIVSSKNTVNLSSKQNVVVPSSTIVYDYKDNLNFIQNYDESYNIDEIDNMVNRFSKMNLYSYEEAVDILKRELPNNIDNYPNLEVAIMRTLTTNAYNDGRLNGDIIPNNLSYEEIESLALDYLRMYEKDDVYHKQLVLAVLRLESGWGRDKNPNMLNNYGNIRDFKTGEFIKYKTSELGIESYVRNILNIESKAINSLKEENMNINNENVLLKTSYIYCEDAAGWYKSVNEIMEDVEEDYNFSNQTKTNFY